MQQEEVQRGAVELAKALAAMIASIREALEAYDASPSEGFATSANKWRSVALPNLSADLQQLQPCLTHTLTPATAQTMLNVTSNEIGLAKHLDAFCLDFSGPEHQRSIESNVYRTVVAASALIEALRKPL